MQRFKREQQIRDELKQKAYEYSHRYDFDEQDNNAADPEQAAWDDIGEEL